MSGCDDSDVAAEAAAWLEQERRRAIERLWQNRRDIRRITRLMIIVGVPFGVLLGWLTLGMLGVVADPPAGLPQAVSLVCLMIVVATPVRFRRAWALFAVSWGVWGFGVAALIVAHTINPWVPWVLVGVAAVFWVVVVAVSISRYRRMRR